MSRRISLPMLRRAYTARAGNSENMQPKRNTREVDFPRRIFSGIQPSGALHLGNYLGAMRQWLKFQEDGETTSYCIVDLHSITLPQQPEKLRENILQLAAAIFACGIDPQKSTVFVQSAVKEHSELCWILGTQATMARLGHLPQYKEKSRLMKEIPLGLYLYPVLQAADICLYKSTHIPVGEDQLQHIQLAQHLGKTFNTKFGKTFPICQAIIEEKEASRIRSLRDPSKKMSKSDTDPRATLNIMDEPEVIREKFQKALTDFTSDVTYDIKNRPGVSNIVAIHSLVTGMSINDILKESASLDTYHYKLRVADAVIEHLNPIRSRVKQLYNRHSELTELLEDGANKAREVAARTMEEVRNKMGIGTYFPPFLSQKRATETADVIELPANQDSSNSTKTDNAPIEGEIKREIV